MAIAPPTPSDLAALQSLQSISQVAKLFNTTTPRLLYILYGRRRPSYHIFSIPKASGGDRHIFSPPSVIRVYQRKLLSCMTEWIQPKDPVHGFTPQRSVVT